jgi:serine/threonine-protein kinase RsbW
MRPSPLPARRSDPEATRMADEKRNPQDQYDWQILGERRRPNERRAGDDQRPGNVEPDGADRRTREDRRIAPQRPQDQLGADSGDEKAVKMELPTQTDYISLVRQFVGGISRKAGFGDIDIEKIELAIDEACSNVLQHAYKYESDNRYAVEITIRNTKLDIVITDQGDSFSFHDAVVPDIEQHVSELKVGGLGIFIMQQMMDDVKYETRANNNILRLTKFIHHKEA